MFPCKYNGNLGPRWWLSLFARTTSSRRLETRRMNLHDIELRTKIRESHQWVSQENRLFITTRDEHLLRIIYTE